MPLHIRNVYTCAHSAPSGGRCRGECKKVVQDNVTVVIVDTVFRNKLEWQCLSIPIMCDPYFTNAANCVMYRFGCSQNCGDDVVRKICWTYGQNAIRGRVGLYSAVDDE